MAKKSPENLGNAPVDAAPNKIKAKGRMNNELVKPDAPAAASDSSAKSGDRGDKKSAKAKTAQKSDKPNIFKRMWKGIKGIVSELKKVTWPKGKDVAKSTAVVLVVVVAFFIVLFGIDYVLTGLFHLVTSGEWASIV